MSSLLFLGFVGAFVFIAYWAFKNDGMASDGSGTGLLAMQQPAGAKQKSVPKWKKAAMPDRPRVSAAQEKKPSAKAGWQRSLQYRKDA